MKSAKLTILVLLLAAGAWASTEKVLYNFAGGSDGASPYDTGHLVRDSSGNFYGTTYQGGKCGAGTVFEVSSAGRWTETVLHNFAGGNSDGAYPMYGSLTLGTGTGKLRPQMGKAVPLQPPLRPKPNSSRMALMCHLYRSSCHVYRSVVPLSWIGKGIILVVHRATKVKC